MPTVAQRMKSRELARLPDDGNRYELITGELHMMSPAGNTHGRIAARLTAMLWQYVEAENLGVVYAAETGFLLAQAPDTVRAPDVAFVRADRLIGLGDVDGYLPLAPDLVIEVVSPYDRFSDVEAKALAWMDAGVRMALVADPGTRSVRVYRTPQAVTILRDDAVLDAGDAVPGWSIPVAEVF